LEVKIGIQSITREIVVETPATSDEVERSLTKALKDGGMFSVRDEKGGLVLVPAEKIGYIELSGSEQRRVGFG
jgi:predicted methyltransferase